jgi:hypothetical protein
LGTRVTELTTTTEQRRFFCEENFGDTINKVVISPNRIFRVMGFFSVFKRAGSYFFKIKDSADR